MKECSFYEQLNFIFQRYEEMDGVRDQDYHVTLYNRGVVPPHCHYRGILFNSGYAAVACSMNDGYTNLEHPKFFILEPDHAKSQGYLQSAGIRESGSL